MADYNNNQQSNVNNVNSNSIALFSSEGNMLRIGFRNDLLILTIIPKVIGEDGRPHWPKDMGRTAMIRPHNAAALYEKAKKDLIPCIERDEPYNGYLVVATNRDNTNLVGFGYNGGRVTFNILMNVGLDRKCNEITSFIFDVVPIISEYNPQTGSYKIQESQGQFAVILQALYMCARHMSGVVAHTNKVNGYFNTNQMISYLRAIATKVGATPAQYGNFGGVRDDGPVYASGGGLFTGGDRPQSGADGATTWAMGNTMQADIGHKVMPEVQQLSSLESLMGDAVNMSTEIKPLEKVK